MSFLRFVTVLLLASSALCAKSQKALDPPTHPTQIAPVWPTRFISNLTGLYPTEALTYSGSWHYDWITSRWRLDICFPFGGKQMCQIQVWLALQQTIYTFVDGAPCTSSTAVPPMITHPDSFVQGYYSGREQVPEVGNVWSDIFQVDAGLGRNFSIAMTVGQNYPARDCGPAPSPINPSGPLSYACTYHQKITVGDFPEWENYFNFNYTNCKPQEASHKALPRTLKLSHFFLRK